MASRGHSWFDVEKLLPGESLIREARARLRTPSPPGWWEGTLVLTSDRLFFLPDVGNPLIDHDVAYWLDEMEEVPAGPHRLRVHRRGSGAPSITFQILGTIGGRGDSWVRAIERARPGARAATALEPQQRRAAAG
jgi:hypothetical protein